MSDQQEKPKEFWTNWMSMHDNLDEAKDNWPKAEWEDLRCYVAYEDYESQRAVIEKLEAEYKTLFEVKSDLHRKLNNCMIASCDEGQRMALETIEQLRADKARLVEALKLTRQLWVQVPGKGTTQAAEALPIIDKTLAEMGLME